MAGSGASDTEKKAVNWPEAEYRSWVQSQVASRILLQFGGVTAATLVGAYLWINDQIQDERQSIVDELRLEFSTQIQTSVGETLGADLPGEVARQLLDQSNLIDEAVAILREEWPETVDNLVQEDEFIDTASAAVFSALQSRAASQRIILDEAMRTMGDASSSPATRALSVEIFALFYPGVRSVRSDTPIMREVLHGVLRNSVDEHGGLPEEVIYAVLENYPIGPATVTEEESGDCGPVGEICENLDSDVIGLVLELLQYTDPSPDEQAVLGSFFDQIPQRQVVRALNWAIYSENQALQEAILASLLGTDDISTRSTAVEQLAVSLEANPESTGFRFAAQTLASLDTDLELFRSSRDFALQRVWAAIEPEVTRSHFEFELGFGGVHDDFVRNLTSYEANRRLQPPTEPVFVNDSSWGGTPQFQQAGTVYRDELSDALLALLRPGRGDDHEHSGGLEEWDITFERTIGRDNRRLALQTMAIAVQRDASRGLDVRAVADRLLGEARDARSVDHNVLAIAITHAGDEPFSALVDQDYEKTWIDLGGSPVPSRSALAAFNRLISDGRAAQWLAALVVDVDTMDDRFEEHLLRTFAKAVEDRLSTRQFPGLPLERALRASLAAQQSRLIEGTELTELFLGQLLLASANEADYWPVAAILENTQALLGAPGDQSDNGEIIAELRARYPWIGRPLGGDVTLVSMDPSASALQLEGEVLDAFGGRWFRLVVPSVMSVRIAGATDGQVVLFDRERSQTVNRHSGSPDDPEFLTLLQPGEYAVHWRQRTETEGRLALSLNQDVIGPGDRTNLRTVTAGDYRFFSGTEGGEAWLRVSLLPSQTLAVETFELMSDLEDFSSVDTEVYFYEPEGFEIGRDDDGGNGLYSRLRYTTLEAEDVIIRINEYFDEPFRPDLSVGLSVRIRD